MIGLGDAEYPEGGKIIRRISPIANENEQTKGSNMSKSEVSKENHRYMKDVQDKTKMVAMITAGEDGKQSIVRIAGVSQNTNKPIRVSAGGPVIVRPLKQLPVITLKTVPWNYGGSSEGKADNTGAKGNPLGLPERVIRTARKEAATIPEEKIVGFLSKVGHRDAEIVRKLQESAPLISLLDVAMTSDDHLRSLIKVLEEAHVPKDISARQYGQLVGHVLDSNVISFTDDDIPSEGTGHRMPLHITVVTSGHTVNGVLIDGGSALNICPLDTLERMKIPLSRMRTSHIVVRAFDGSRRDTVGEIELPVEIGPCTFEIPFQVLKITTGYNMLLGRPWIHMAGAVPSTLHQQLKFICKGQLVTVTADSARTPNAREGLPTISMDESIEPSSFQTLEVSDVFYQPLGTPLPKPTIAPEVTSMAREMMNLKFQPGSGLGKSNQGIIHPIHLPSQKNRTGLGYRGSSKHRNPYKKESFLVTQAAKGRATPSRSEEVDDEPHEEDDLKLTAFEKERQEEFLQEVHQLFEEKCGFSDHDQKKDPDVGDTQILIPFIDWTRIDIPGGSGKDDPQVMAITG